MSRSIDDDLQALAQRDFDHELEGLEDRIWARVGAQRDAARASSIGVRAALTLAALTLGLVFGVMHPPRPTHLSEMGVLSEDGAFAPSIRLGG
jgi:hypothetical protein